MKHGDQNASSRTGIESLEPRMLLAGDALTVMMTTTTTTTTTTITPQSTAAGLILYIQGTPDVDRVRVFPLAEGLQVRVTGLPIQNFAGDFAGIVIDLGDGDDRGILDASIAIPATICGGNGADLLRGGAGDDKLYAGAVGGRDRLEGFGGDDVIVSIGNADNDVHSGGDGRDSFWIDAADTEMISDISAEESATGSVHRISRLEGWYGTRATLPQRHTATLLDGQDLADPEPTSNLAMANFSANPLFARGGPSARDVAQGALDDGSFLAALASVVSADPVRIRESVVALGDGTFAVEFFNGSRSFIYRVDGDLPVRADGTPAYAALGAQGSTWVAIMEKAYAQHQIRRPDATYRAAEGGHAVNVIRELGYRNARVIGASAWDDLTEIQATSAQGADMTFWVQVA